jgi:hypothetical protein
MGESGFSHLCTLMKTPVFAGKKIRYGVARRGVGRQPAADRLTELGCREVGSLALCDALGPKLGSVRRKYVGHRQGLLGENCDTNKGAP